MLHDLQLQMMRTDIFRERRIDVTQRKQALFDTFDDEFRRAIADGVADVDISGPVAATRSRALIILIELMTFNPWFPDLTWVKDARKASLETAVAQLPGLGDGDFASATAEYDALIKQLKRKSVRWGRVAAVSAVGLGLGVATAGLAAPVIGGAVGAALGLSGAAATSAGLALLGGGSIAAGGFGILGGTILVSGVGGVFAAGAAGATVRFSRMGAAAVVADAVKLDLLARLVLADAADHDQKLRRVAEGLQARINEFSESINLLTERIAQLKADKDRLSEENRSLKEELATLREDRAQAENAKLTLEVVLDRLPVVS